MKSKLTNYSHSSLAKHPEYYKDTLRLIETSLHYNDKNHFDIDFYPLMNPNNFKNNHILIDSEKKVIAHIGFKERELIIEKKTFPVVLVGGICVDESRRGQGIFKRFFEDCLQSYIQKNSLILLWSDQSILYEKFGFYQAGSINQMGTDIFDFTSAPEFIEKGSLDDNETFDEVKSIYKAGIQDKCLCLVRNESHWNEIHEIKSTELYLIKRAQITEGYFFKDKGEDLSGIIHEIAFRDNAEYYLDRLKEYQIWIPEHKYNKYPGVKNLYTCFMKIGSHEHFKNLILSYTNEAIEIMKIEHNKVTFSFEGGTLELNIANFIQVVFGPGRAQELSKLRPLFIGGVDSI